MAAPSNPSPNTLLRPKSKRRLSTLNFGVMFIIVGLVGAIFLIVAFSLSQLNAKPDNTIVNGAPVTQGSSPQELGMTGPSYQGAGADAATATPVYRTPAQAVATATPHPQPTYAPPPAENSGGGASSAAQDEAATQVREQRRHAAEVAREQLRQRQERVDSAMRSLGGVTVAEQRDTSAGLVSSGSPAGGTQASPAQEREYAAPNGPTLALDTSIPVETDALGRFDVRRPVRSARDKRCPR